MKTLTSFFFAALLSVSSVFAQADDAFVANWVLPIQGWYSGADAPIEGVAAHPRSVAAVTSVDAFDAASADFDAVWATAGVENTLANQLGFGLSDNGAEDFTGSFKVLYDESNIYILLQWTEENVTGTESAEVCLSPYFKLDATPRSDAPTLWYNRWSQFGAHKLTFKKTGFDVAMMVTFDANGAGDIAWGGTTETITNNTFVDDKTASGSSTVKWIITIGYPVLTGSQRPTFTSTDLLNGISFDLKVNDVDGDDALSADEVPVLKPAEYWFSATNNEAYRSTIYAGFLVKDNSGTTSVNQVKAIDFATITSTQIELNAAANVTVYNALGKQIIDAKNATIVNVSNLSKGAYIVRANGQSQKFVR